MKARRLLVVGALLCVVSIAPGCSSEQSTSTTTTRSTVSNPDNASGSAETYPAPPPSSTTTTTTSSSEPDSVLGATFHLVGTIIMLPFRIIGLVV
jgi:hypothetical protein